MELGEDAAKNGVYSFSYTLYDLSGAEHTYDLSASFFTQAMTTINGTRYLAVIPSQEDPESLQ